MRSLHTWVAIFFVLAIVAAVLGFGGIAVEAAGMAKLTFVALLVGVGALLAGSLVRRS